ncbi:serine/threonine-protein kinase SMG1, partial [Trifolium pratense]
ALEGIGESQEVKSQDIALSTSDAGVGDAVEFNGKEGESLSRSDDDKTEDIIGFSQLSLEEKGWISPPDSSFCSSSGSDITSADISLPDSLNDLAENTDMLSQVSSSRNLIGHLHTTSLSQIDVEEISLFEESKSFPLEADLDGADSVMLTNEATEHPKAMPFHSDKSVASSSVSQNPSNENLDKFDGEDDLLSTVKVKNGTEHRETPDADVNISTRVGRGKNAYALSVLRRVEMKIDGRDISERREISIAEQVDYLLKQATSADNLCNISIPNIMQELASGIVQLIKSYHFTPWLRGCICHPMTCSREVQGSQLVSWGM